MSPSLPSAPVSPSEHWFQTQLVGVMTPGEAIFGATYLKPYLPSQNLLADAADGLAGIRRRSAYVVVTDRRVLLVQTPIGAFDAPVFQNLGVRAIDRGEIRGVGVGRWAVFELADGTFLEYLVGPSAKYFPTQPAFVASVVSWLGASPGAARRIRELEAERRRKLLWWGTLAAMCILYAVYVRSLGTERQAVNVYWVRAGGEVRGPVPEEAVVAWLKQGMRDAEISVDGATFVPIARSTLAHLLEHASPFGGKAKRVLAFLGPLCLFAFVMWSRVSRIESVHTRAKLRESLPKVGAEGELRADAASLRLCPGNGGLWGWPCSRGDASSIAPGSHARVMKADLRGDEALCRYWIKGGPNNGAGGDGLCAWFQIEVDGGGE